MRKQVALIALTLSLCVPAMAQEAHPEMSKDARTWQKTEAAQQNQQELWTGEDEREEWETQPAETLEKTLQFLQANEPEIVQEMDKVKTTDPDEYQHMLTMESHHVRTLEDLQESDPEGFRLQIAEMRAHDRVGLIARAYREGTNHGDRSDLKAAVEALFVARQQVERHDLAEAQKELTDWNNDIQARDAKRARIVEHYTMEISYPDAERW